MDKEEQRIQWHALQLDELCKTLKDIKSGLQRGEYNSCKFYEQISKILAKYSDEFKDVQNDRLFNPALFASFEEGETGRRRRSRSRNSSNAHSRQTRRGSKNKKSSTITASVEKCADLTVFKHKLKSCSVRLERLSNPSPSSSTDTRRKNRRSARKEKLMRGLQSLMDELRQYEGLSSSDEEGCEIESENSDERTQGNYSCGVVVDNHAESGGNDTMEPFSHFGDVPVEVAPTGSPYGDQNPNGFTGNVSTDNSDDDGGPDPLGPIIEPHSISNDEERLVQEEPDVKFVVFQTNWRNHGRRNIRPVRETWLPETEAAVKKEVERSERIAERDALREEILLTENEEGHSRNIILDFDPATGEPAVMLDPTLIPKLLDYQLEGIKFMYDNCFESIGEYSRPQSEGGGCILAHCMGLGKTFQVVAFVHAVMTSRSMNVQRVMVLCPPTTVDNWVYEFNSWLQECQDRIQVFNFVDMKSKPTHKRVSFLQSWYDRGGVLISSYSFFRSTLTQKDVFPALTEKIEQLLLDPGPDFIVCDEGHILKSSDTKLVPLLNHVRTRRRVILTGTPLQNNLMEYHTMLDFVKPKLLGTASEFRNGFINPIKNGQHRDSTNEDVILMKKRSYVLHKLLENCVHRLGYSVLVPFIPPKYEYCIVLRPSELQKRLYNGYLKFIGPAQARISQNKFFGDFTQVSKMLSHPVNLTYSTSKKKSESSCSWWQQYVTTMDSMSQLGHSNKFLVLFDIIDYCIAEGDKIVIFSQYKYTLNLIEGALQSTETSTQPWKKGIHYFRLDGDVVSEKRQKMVNDFNGSDSCAKLFLLSTRAGGVGINLVSANRVIIFDASFNPAMDLQAVFRTYRLGQTKPCYVYRLLTGGTMEEAVYRQQVTKLSLAERVVDEQNPERHFREDDFINIYAPLAAESPSAVFLEPPADTVLEKVILKSGHVIQTYLNHKDLLENQDEDDLTEEDKQAALLEYENLTEQEQLVDFRNETMTVDGASLEHRSGEETMTQDAEITDHTHGAQKIKRQRRKSSCEIPLTLNKEPMQYEETLTEISERQTNKFKAAAKVPTQTKGSPRNESDSCYEVPMTPSPTPLTITIDDSSDEESEEVSDPEDPRAQESESENTVDVAGPSRCYQIAADSTQPAQIHNAVSVTEAETNVSRPNSPSIQTLVHGSEENPTSGVEPDMASPRSNYEDFEYEENPSEDEDVANDASQAHEGSSRPGEDAEKYQCRKRRRTCSNEVSNQSYDRSRPNAVRTTDSGLTNNSEKGDAIITTVVPDGSLGTDVDRRIANIMVSLPDSDKPRQVSLLTTKSHCEVPRPIPNNPKGNVKSRLGPLKTNLLENQKDKQSVNQNAHKQQGQRHPSPNIVVTLHQKVVAPVVSKEKSEKTKEETSQAEKGRREVQIQAKSQPGHENRVDVRASAASKQRRQQSQNRSRSRGRGLPPRHQQRRRTTSTKSRSGSPRRRSVSPHYSRQSGRNQRSRGSRRWKPYRDEYSSRRPSRSRSHSRSRSPDHRRTMNTMSSWDRSDEPGASEIGLPSYGNFPDAGTTPFLPPSTHNFLPTQPVAQYAPTEPNQFYEQGSNTSYPPMYFNQSYTNSSNGNFYYAYCSTFSYGSGPPSYVNPSNTHQFTNTHSRDSFPY